LIELAFRSRGPQHNQSDWNRPSERVGLRARSLPALLAQQQEN